MEYAAWTDRLIDMGLTVDAAAWAATTPRHVLVYYTYGDGVNGTAHENIGGGRGAGEHLGNTRYSPTDYGYPCSFSFKPAQCTPSFVGGIWERPL